MSAAVCGSKRSCFEDIPSPPSSKRIRCSLSSSSPPRFSSPPSPSPLDQLRTAFPNLETKVLSRVLEECGNSLEAAMQSCLTSSEERLVSTDEAGAEDGFTNNDDTVVSGNIQSVSENLPTNGAQWVELLVREMSQATSMDDAKIRASRVLEVLEKAISDGTRDEAGNRLQEENMVLKQQIEALIKDNGLLKRAVAIQHERQKEYEETNRELQFLKQIAPQVQEKLRNLEMENYALRMQLRQAEQGSCILGRYNPDVF